MWPQQIEIVQCVTGFAAYTKTMGCWGATKAKAVSNLQIFLKEGVAPSNSIDIFKLEPPGHFKFLFEQGANPLPTYAHPRQTVKYSSDQVI